MKHFCHNPFIGIDVATSGRIKPCCRFIGTEIPKFNIKDGIESYKNSEWLKGLQKQFLSGEKPKGCEQCWREESAGVLSKRQLDYKRHKKEFDNVNLDQNNFINVELAFGNLCNLACRICSPNQSSKWASEKKKQTGENYPIWDWFKNPNVMNDIWTHTQKAIHIDVPGGEPLLIDIPEHFEYLQKFVESGRAKEISLHYTTNGTNFPKDEHIKIWQSFREIDIQISIDDIESRFEYNRWPAKWDQVYDNIKKYQKFSKSNSNVRLSISHSVSVFTIFYAEKFFKWCIRENLPAPWLGIVSFPSYYDPAVLPQDIREKISNLLNQSQIKEIRRLKEYLQHDNSKYFTQFLSITRHLDKIRNQNFQTTFPELAELIQHYI